MKGIALSRFFFYTALHKSCIGASNFATKLLKVILELPLFGDIVT